MRKKQRGRVVQRSAASEHTPAQTPRASPSPCRDESPILFEHLDQRPSADASDMVLFGGVEDELLDDGMSLTASDAETMLGSTIDPGPLPSADSRDTKAGMDAELFRVLSKVVEEPGLVWSTPEEPTRSRLDE